LQENLKWREKVGKLLTVTDNIDYDIEGLLLCYCYVL